MKNRTYGFYEAGKESIMSIFKKKAKKTGKTLIAYKGFNLDWTCRDFKFEVGKTFKHKGEVSLCNSGFHACEYPIDIFNYYPPTGQIALVELNGVSDETEKEKKGDSKRVAQEITIKAALTIPALITAAIEYTTKNCDPLKANHSKSDQSASSATGDQSASSATGYRSASSATGYRSASSATGDQSASSATGYQSASSATGYRSASSATGYRSASSATGDQSASSATGKNSVAMNIGLYGKAKADKDGAIVLCNHDEKYNIRHIRASKVGENGIKPDTFYILNDKGDFEESK